MGLKLWYNKWKYQQYRVHGVGKDFKWLEELQEKYPDGFLKTKCHLENLEETSSKAKSEIGKTFLLSGGGIPWIIIGSISAWSFPQYLHVWPDVLENRRNKSMNILLICLVSFVIIEVFRIYVIASPYFNIKIIDKFKVFWKKIIEENSSQEDALKKLDLFIAQQYAEKSRSNAMDINGSGIINKGAVFLQWCAVFGVAISGFILFDAQYRINHGMIAKQPTNFIEDHTTNSQ